MFDLSDAPAEVTLGKHPAVTTAVDELTGASVDLGGPVALPAWGCTVLAR